MSYFRLFAAQPQMGADFPSLRGDPGILFEQHRKVCPSRRSVCFDFRGASVSDKCPRLSRAGPSQPHIRAANRFLRRVRRPHRVPNRAAVSDESAGLIPRVSRCLVRPNVSTQPSRTDWSKRCAALRAAQSSRERSNSGNPPTGVQKIQSSPISPAPAPISVAARSAFRCVHAGTRSEMESAHIRNTAPAFSRRAIQAQPTFIAHAARIGEILRHHSRYLSDSILQIAFRISKNALNAGCTFFRAGHRTAIVGSGACFPWRIAVRIMSDFFRRVSTARQLNPWR